MSFAFVKKVHDNLITSAKIRNLKLVPLALARVGRSMDQEERNMGSKCPLHSGSHFASGQLTFTPKNI